MKYVRAIKIVLVVETFNENRQGAALVCDWWTICHVHVSLQCHMSAFAQLTGYSGLQWRNLTKKDTDCSCRVTSRRVRRIFLKTF
ncbi:hypothetical protein LDENG_00283530 [Lucifuga dentata]|nr:hypothetical protein LDENG_00283530 [Lucifuga dentata]